MYPASREFHQAVADGAHQIALLIFDRGSDDEDLAVFTNDDINVSAGIEFNDYFNTEEDLTIGQALSNEISFNLFNDKGLLDDYEFGEFTATMGVLVEEHEVDDRRLAYAESKNAIYVATTESPYILRNGDTPESTPDSPVVSILIYKGNVYCGLENGSIKVYKDSNGTAVDYTPNDFMISQMLSANWLNCGFCFDYEVVDAQAGISNWVMHKWKRYTEKTYEFVPLGVFTAERPNVPYVNEIHMTCYDQMQKFEKDMVTFSTLGLTSGTSTISDLYDALCDYLNVEHREQTLINGSATITETDDFKNVTMREVLQWIAEAAASVARFDRDGYLMMDWVGTAEHVYNIVMDEGKYSEFNPYWYETKRVTKLYNRASNGDYDNSVGSGDEAYLIQDNPLLKGVSGNG